MPVTFVRVVFATVLICLLALGTGQAAGGSVYISQVEGTFEPGKLTPGGTLRIHIAISNDTDVVIEGVTLGFEVEASGATYDTITSEWAPEFDVGVFTLLYALPVYGDLTPPDTMAIEGAKFIAGGIEPGFDGDVAIFEIGPIYGPLGATVTFDSAAAYGPALLQWAMSGGIGDPFGDLPFAGMTFELAECCVGTTGNVTGGEDIVSLTDFSILRNHLFITFEELPCWKEANVDASPDGVINLTDITKLVNHLFVTFEPLPACP